MTAPLDLEYKSAPTMDPPGTPVKPDHKGIVETLVAVTGVRDDVGDVIVPGAFARTLKDRKPKVVLGHDWNRPIGKVLDIKELLPGDARLPETTADGRPWPKEAGAVWARYQANMDTEDGRTAFLDAKFYGPEESTYSIGYKTIKARHKGDTRYIEDLDLFEFGPVLHPANRLATLQSIKSGEPDGIEVADILASWEAVKSTEPDGMTFQDYSASLMAVDTEAKAARRYVQDATYWGYPKGTLILPGMKPRGKKARVLRERGVLPSRNVGVAESEDAARSRTRTGTAADVAVRMGDEGLDLGLPDAGLTSDARVRARKPKGRDEEHEAELLNSLVPGTRETDEEREVRERRRDVAFERLLDEGITPNELSEDLAEHEARPNDVDDEAIADAVARYTVRYREVAAEQAAERAAGKPDADKPDADKPDADKPDADKPDADKPDADKPKPDAEKPDPKEVARRITAVAEELGLRVEVQAVRTSNAGLVRSLRVSDPETPAGNYGSRGSVLRWGVEGGPGEGYAQSGNGGLRIPTERVEDYLRAWKRLREKYDEPRGDMVMSEMDRPAREAAARDGRDAGERRAVADADDAKLTAQYEQYRDMAQSLRDRGVEREGNAAWEMIDRRMALVEAEMDRRGLDRPVDPRTEARATALSRIEATIKRLDAVESRNPGPATTAAMLRRFIEFPDEVEASPDGRLAARWNGNTWVTVDTGTGQNLPVPADVETRHIPEILESLARLDIPWGDGDALRALWENDPARRHADQVAVIDILNEYTDTPIKKPAKPRAGKRKPAPDAGDAVGTLPDGRKPSPKVIAALGGATRGRIKPESDRGVEQPETEGILVTGHENTLYPLQKAGLARRGFVGRKPAYVLTAEGERRLAPYLPDTVKTPGEGGTAEGAGEGGTAEGAGAGGTAEGAGAGAGAGGYVEPDITPTANAALPPQEYRRLQNEADARQYRADEIERDREKYRERIAATAASERMPAEAPDAIPADQVPDNGVLVAGGRLVLTDATRQNWALRTASGAVVASAYMFGDYTGPKTKLKRAQLNSLAERIAAITDGAGNRIPTTLGHTDWTKGFRDSDGRGGPAALAHAIVQWGDANGVAVNPTQRASADATPRPSREPGVPDAEGFYPDERALHLVPGDRVRMDDGTVRTVREVRKLKDSNRTPDGVLVYWEGLDDDERTRYSLLARVDVQHSYDVDDLHDPGMGYQNTDMGERPDEIRSQGDRVRELIADGKAVTPGTRFVYTPSEGVYRKTDTRPRVGTVTDRWEWIAATGGWFQVVRYDDGTYDALNLASMRDRSDSGIELDPPQERQLDARRAWGLEPGPAGGDATTQGGDTGDGIGPTIDFADIAGLWAYVAGASAPAGARELVATAANPRATQEERGSAWGRLLDMQSSGELPADVLDRARVVWGATNRRSGRIDLEAARVQLRRLEDGDRTHPIVLAREGGFARVVGVDTQYRSGGEQTYSGRIVGTSIATVGSGADKRQALVVRVEYLTATPHTVDGVNRASDYSVVEDRQTVSLLIDGANPVVQPIEDPEPDIVRRARERADELTADIPGRELDRVLAMRRADSATRTILPEQRDAIRDMTPQRRADLATEANRRLNELYDRPNYGFDPQIERLETVLAELVREPGSWTLERLLRMRNRGVNRNEVIAGMSPEDRAVAMRENDAAIELLRRRNRPNERAELTARERLAGALRDVGSDGRRTPTPDGSVSGLYDPSRYSDAELDARIAEAQERLSRARAGGFGPGSVTYDDAKLAVDVLTTEKNRRAGGGGTGAAGVVTVAGVEWTPRPVVGLRDTDERYTAKLPNGDMGTVTRNGDQWSWAILGNRVLDDFSGFDTYATREDAMRAILNPQDADPDRGIRIGREPRRDLRYPPDAPGTGGTTGDVERVDPDDVGDARDLGDEALGLGEDEDGELVVTPEVAERQDRVERLLRAVDTGSLDLAARSDEELVDTRRDVADELRLQEAVRRRDAAAGRPEGGTTGGGSRGGGGGTDDGEAVPEAPRKRPGLAGAAEDYAEALESGDSAAVERTRARLLTSLRRSRSDSAHAQALRAHLEADAADDPAEIRRLAEALRTEARERRNATARDRRRVKRLERERLRSLLGQIDAEMRRRDIAVPDDGRDADTTGDGSTADTRMIGGLAYTAEDATPGQAMWTTTLPDGRTGGVRETGGGWAWFIRGANGLDDRADGFDTPEAATATMLDRASDSFGAPRGIPAPGPEEPRVPDVDPDLPPADFEPIPPPVSWTLSDLGELDLERLSILLERMAETLPSTGVPEADAGRVEEGRNLVLAEYRRRGVERMGDFPDGEWFTLAVEPFASAEVKYLRTGDTYLDEESNPWYPTPDMLDWPAKPTTPPPPPPPREYPPGKEGARQRLADLLADPTIPTERRQALREAADTASLYVRASNKGTLLATRVEGDEDEWRVFELATGEELTNMIGPALLRGRNIFGADDLLNSLEELPGIPWGDREAMTARWSDTVRKSVDGHAFRSAIRPEGVVADGVLFKPDTSSTGRRAFSATRRTTGVLLVVRATADGKWEWFGDNHVVGDGEKFDTAQEAAEAAVRHDVSLSEVEASQVADLGAAYDEARAAHVLFVKSMPKSTTKGYEKVKELRREAARLENARLEARTRYERARAKLPAGQVEEFDHTRYSVPVWGGDAKTRKTIQGMFRNVITDGLTARQVRALTDVEIMRANGFSGQNTLADYSLSGHNMRIGRHAFSRSDADHKATVDAGWWVPGKKLKPLEQTVTHEMGHHMDSLLSADQRHAMFAELSDKLRELEPAAQPYRTAQTGARMWSDEGAKGWVEQNKALIIKHVSTYASHSQFEVIAELWTEFRGNDNPRPLARIVGRHLMGALRDNETA